MSLSARLCDVVGRRIALVVLVVLVAAVAGVEARDLRSQQANTRKGDDPSGGAAAAPTATPVPTWYTRRVDLPSDIAPWSLRISPDGTGLIALTPKNAFGSITCTPGENGAPVCPTPPPVRVVRYAVDDPPGAIAATLTRLWDAPQSAGTAWLPDGGVLVAELNTAPQPKATGKTVSVVAIDPGGKSVSLDVLAGGALPPVAESRDGRWLAAGEASAQLQLIDRRTGASRHVPLGDIGLPAESAWIPLAWSGDGRVLVAKDSTLLRVAPDGAVERTPGPAGERLVGVVSTSPDGSIAVARAYRPQVEGEAAFVDGRWVDLPLDALRLSSMPIWVTPHEILTVTSAHALGAFDPRTGATRDLGFTMRASDPRILGYSAPYLMWRDGDAGRIHLLDTRSVYDVLAGVQNVTGVQTYNGGGFLLLHQDGAELLTGADWFARVPPTAAPFVSAPPGKAGANDPFADVAALPRLDQMTTGGALEVASKSATTKRVTSPDGGWSIEIPVEWRADVGRLRGGELYSYDPTGMDNGGNYPPASGIHLSLTLWPDFEKRGPSWLADHQSQPYRTTQSRRDTVEVAGMPAERLIVRGDAPPSLDITVAYYYLRHPSFDDRVLEIQVWRADMLSLAATEKVLATLQLTSAASGPRGPLLTRAEAVAKAFGYLGVSVKPTESASVLDRFEAKLVTNKELELAMASGRGFIIDADTPVWVVMRFGDFPEPPHSAPMGYTFGRWTYQLSVIEARRDSRTGGFMGGGGGGEPAWWASLRDRAQ